MRLIIWTNFAVSELKSIFIFYRITAGDHVANKIRKSILTKAKTLIKHPFAGEIEENLIDLKQGHRYIISGNYKIIYKVSGKNIYITDVFDCRQNPVKMKRKLL